MVLINVFSYLPSKSFLPISHVSKRFKDTWIQYKSSEGNLGEESDINETNPLAIGHLFEKSWRCQAPSNSNLSTSGSNNKLNTSLLAYFICNGYGSSSSNLNEKSHILKKVMLETASRGDIEGMWFMKSNKYFGLDDEEICTMAGAAGQLEALKWLRGENVGTFNKSDGERNVCCPWDPTEIHREAAENLHDDVIEYVEKNCKGHEIQMHYGVGLPW